MRSANSGCDHYARWNLIVAGKRMGTSTDEVRNHAEASGVDNRVEVHEHPSDDELKQLIGRSSIYCCASSYEGFGLAAVEAASAGLFPVLSHIPPFEQTLERLGCGMLVDFEDPSSWAESYGSLTDLSTDFRKRFDRGRIAAAVAPFAWPAAMTEFERA